MTHTKDEALKLALDDLIAEYHMETSSFAKRVDDIFKQALAAPVQEPFWHAVVSEQAPVVDKAIRRLDIAEEYAAQCRPHYPGVEVVSLYRATPPAHPAVQEPVTKSFMVHLYNFGYKAGHHDTVEGRYIDICRQDMETYHLEDVSEWLQDMVYTAAAQPAVQEGRDWSLLEATQESLREHMAEIKRLKAEQPVPVKTYHDGKPWPVAPVPNGPYSAPIKELWPVAPKPWVGLSDEELNELTAIHSGLPLYRAIEAKLRSKNHG